MKTIYLKTNNDWHKFEYENISELEKELTSRSISISSNSYVNNSSIGNGSTVDGSTVNGSRVLNGSTVDGEILPYNALFAINLYRYSVSAYFNKKGEQIIQLGCYNRTRKEWEDDFWNNVKEFPNDGSDKSEARMRAFKLACFFF